MASVFNENPDQWGAVFRLNIPGTISVGTGTVDTSEFQFNFLGTRYADPPFVLGYSVSWERT